ncbi:MAG: hypothetical protein AAFV33_02580 [Chloroflexota bacterium]
MAVTASWYDDDRRIVHFRFQHPWTIGEFFAVNGTMGAEVATFTHEVDALLDFTASGPISLEAVMGFRRVTSKNGAIQVQGISVVFGHHTLPVIIKSITAVIPAAANRIYLAQDIDDALRIIADHRAS